MFFENKKLASTPLSDFIRNASSARKKRVYREVIEKSTQQQKKVVAAARVRQRRPALIG